MSQELVIVLLLFFVIVVIFLAMGGQLKKLSVGKWISAEFHRDKRYSTRIRVVLSRPRDVVRQTVNLSLDGKLVATFKVLEGEKEQDVQALRLERPGEYHYHLALKGVERLFDIESRMNVPLEYTASGEGLLPIRSEKTYVISSELLIGGPDAGRRLSLTEFGSLDDSKLPEDLVTGLLHQLNEAAKKSGY